MSTSQRINRCLPNQKRNGGGNLLLSERLSSHDHAKVAFGMADMGAYNRNQRTVDEFGGEPFYQHTGQACHRGANPHKKANFHPSSTVKRCIYQSDGSGRDGYISVNNGGLSIPNRCGVNGTDIGHMYSESLRGYGKDTAGPGYQPRGAPVRIADDYIQKQLKFEDADFSVKYMRQLGRSIEKANVDQFRNKRNDLEAAQKQFMSEAQSSRISSTDEIRQLLHNNQHKFTKNELYFRKQEKLMQNAIIPESERFRQNQKMKFQTKHTDLLSMPKRNNLRDKYSIGDEKALENAWATQNRSPRSFVSHARHNSQLPLNANTQIQAAAAQKPGRQSIDENTRALNLLMNQKPRRDLNLAGSILVGQGTSLEKTGGSFQRAISHGVQNRHTITVQENNQKANREDIEPTAKITLKQSFKPRGSKDKKFDLMLNQKLNKAGLF